MTECSQKFKDMLAEYRRGAHHEDLMIDDFVANPAAILQYVAELEALRDKVREVVGPLAADMVGGMP